MFEEDSLVKNLVPAVEQQMESDQTPFVKQTYDRLVKLGEEEAEAKMLIAFCLAVETNRMFSEKVKFNTPRYKEMLDQLPEMPE